MYMGTAIVAVAIIFFLIVSPGFRKFAMVFIVAGGVGVYFLLVKNNSESAKRQETLGAQEQLALNSIRADELKFSNVFLDQSGPSWTLRGDVTNNSKYGLRWVQFLVTIQDCPPTRGCVTIGQETILTKASEDLGQGYNLPLVPAGQKRLFESYPMRFANTPRTNNIRWDYKITQIRSVYR
jgi:hypothetical protein